MFLTVNQQYSWPPALNLRAARVVQGLYGERAGVRPTVVSAMQRNPSRQGFHVHMLLCGSDTLLDPRWRSVHQALRSRFQTWSGIGQRYSPRCSHRSCSCELVNRVRTWLVPVRDRYDVTGYVVRYCLREDVEQMVDVLPGDGMLNGVNVGQAVTLA